MDLAVAIDFTHGSPAEQERLLLEQMLLSLTAAAQALGSERPEEVVMASARLRAAAHELGNLYGALAALPFRTNPEARRRQLLEMVHQRALTAALLRRWRRSLILRRNRLDLAQCEAGGASFSDGWF